MMIILCDIGNSFIKSAIFKNEKLIAYNVKKDFSSVLALIGLKEISGVVISSVVPSKLKVLIDELSRICPIKPFIIHRSLKFNLSIKYSTPHSLGIDRLCSAEGAYHLFNNSTQMSKFNKSDYLISIDCGTATTINIIKFPKVFLGGLIAPGLNMMFESLHSFTEQLPRINIEQYKKVIGDSTKTAIASGVINSTLGMIHQTINSLSRPPKQIYITGGNAKYILPHLEFSVKYEKALVLYGIKAIYDKNITIR
jgi:type III pantothenate kinase